LQAEDIRVHIRVYIPGCIQIAVGVYLAQEILRLAYEVFKRTSVRVDTPALSIVPGGRVAINSAACRLLLEAGVKTVVVLWDRTAHKMAVKAAPKGERNSFTVTFASDHHAGSFAAKSFLSHIGWNAPKRERLPTTWNAAEKMFEATLPPLYLASTAIGTKKRTG
jgi:hypothetical protein